MEWMVTSTISFMFCEYKVLCMGFILLKIKMAGEFAFLFYL